MFTDPGSFAELFTLNALNEKAIPVEEDTGQYGHINLQEMKNKRNLVPPNPIEALIFDIYGTLFMSSSGDISLADKHNNQAKSLQTLLSKYSIPAEPDSIIRSLNQAIAQDHARRKKQGADYPEVNIREIWRSISQLSSMSDDDITIFAVEYEAIVNPVAPMPGLQELLQCIPPGFPTGIVSNAQFYTPALFQAFLGQSPQDLGFNSLVYSFQYGYAKPSLRLYEISAEELRKLDKPVPPERALYIGNDMLNDVWAARQTGFQTALFAGDARSFRPRTSDRRCKNLKADFVIDTLDDICLLLGNKEKR